MGGHCVHGLKRIGKAGLGDRSARHSGRIKQCSVYVASLPALVEMGSHLHQRGVRECEIVLTVW